MSNFLAVATVTATLKTILGNALTLEKLPNLDFQVTTLRPDSLGSDTYKTGVNIYLYQVTPNLARRNHDLPTRRADGVLVQQPQLALDLHYLLSFYGDEATLAPQQLFGVTVRTLHVQPVLTRQNILDAIKNSEQHLQGSTLADQVDLVRLTPLSLSLEELSKLWSVFFQTKYTLSVAYQASVVLIEGDSTPQPALPVRQRNLVLVPAGHDAGPLVRISPPEGEAPGSGSPSGESPGGGAPGGESPGGGSPGSETPTGHPLHLLRSTKIDVKPTRQGSTVTFNGEVTVKDEADKPVADALVAATWTLDDGTLQQQTATTNARGVTPKGNAAGFTISQPLGDGKRKVILTVTNITKSDDYIFAADTSKVLSKTAHE